MAKDRNIENLIKILIDEKVLRATNLKRLIQARIYKDTEFLITENDLLLTVDSLITLNNIITGSHILSLRLVNVRPAFHKKQYMDFTKIEFELYKLVDALNDRYITINRRTMEILLSFW